MLKLALASDFCLPLGDAQSGWHHDTKCQIWQQSDANVVFSLVESKKFTVYCTVLDLCEIITCAMIFFIKMWVKT
jgi:hypothetical protein